MDKDTAKQFGQQAQSIATLRADLDLIKNNFRAIDSKVLDAAAHREELAGWVVENLAEFVNVMKLQEARKQREDPDSDMLRMVAYRERRERSEREQEKRYMVTLNRKVSRRKCSCGRHKGINFYEGTKLVIKDFCPVNWWVIQSNLAFKDGELRKFLDENPFERTEQFLLEKK